MKITGQILKENRERKNISINEVAIATKINMKTLQALEDGDVENLPPKTFLRGFVRAYASFLGLDVESVMSTFQEEMGSTRPKASASEEEPPSPRPKPSAQAADEAINPRTSVIVTGGWIVGILVVAILIFFVKRKMDSYEREAVVENAPAGISSLPRDTSTPPPAATSTPSPSEAASPSPSPSASPSPTSSPVTAVAGVVAPMTTPPATPSATPSPTPAPKPTSTPTPTPTATPTPSPTPQPKSSPSPSPSPGPSPSASPVPKAARAQDVIIEALDSVDVEAIIDNEPPKTIKLKGDQVQSIKAKKKIVLKISDGGAINLIVNGTERGVPGDLGKPLRIELP